MTNLFQCEELQQWLKERQDQAVADVKNADPETLQFSPDKVIDHLVEQHDLKELVLDWDSMSQDGGVRPVLLSERQFNEPVQVNVYALTVHVPFTGSKRLWMMKASTFSLSGPPNGDFLDDTLVLTVEERSGESTAMIAALEQLRASINQHVEWVNADVQRWHSTLRHLVEETVADRKTKLDTAAALTDALAIPLKPTTGQKAVSIPVTRKTVRAIEPRAKPTSSELPNDPALPDTIYEDVLRTLRTVGNSFERLPNTAKRFKEEELRDLLLFILNSNYEGAASGEAFNGAGRTDILIRHNDRNAFVGECKMWRGPQEFSKAIDQLLSYTVWRDTKAALILFIKQGDATSIIEKADAAIRKHEGFVSDRKSEESEARRDYLLNQKDDAARTIKLALLPIIVRGSNEVD